MTNLGRWGNGDAEVELNKLEGLPYVMGLVRQAFEKQMGNGGGGSMSTSVQSSTSGDPESSRLSRDRRLGPGGILPSTARESLASGLARVVNSRHARLDRGERSGYDWSAPARDKPPLSKTV